MVWFADKNKNIYIFIHIPRTGGTTVETSMNLLFRPCGYGTDPQNKKKAMQHYLWFDYKKKFGLVYEKTFRFSICRNPYDRLLSEYYWCRMKGIGHKSGQSINEFISFCEKMVTENNYTNSVLDDHFIPQHKYLYDDNDNLMVDRVFRFENFKEIEEYLVTHHEAQPFKKINESKEEKLELSPEQKERIYNIYKKDFDLFGYAK